VANTINIAADVASMGDVLALIIGGNRHLLTVALVGASLLAQVLVPYHSYVKFLKWLTLSLLSYAAVLFTVHVPWREVALRTVAPKLAFDAATATVIVGVFGTTISPYLFFWQSSEEVEELRAKKNERALIVDGAAASRELRRIRWDTWSGMLFSNLTAFFIILATAVTLHVSGVTDVQTAAQAAEALRPVAGDFAFYLFALGILGVGAIGVPVLAGSAAYAIAETMGWPVGLEADVRDAHGFYGVIAGSMIAGLALGFTPINPIKALFYSAIINGVVAAPLTVLVVLLASRRSILGQYTASRSTLVLGWITALLMACASVGMLIPS
jgi:Mn2+/Fe2+ NRAMP family transporter